ncbi:hypothetical protein GGX14DRAFT_653044 [Mycena pura]|uniref:Uncharacterized protein n=1 Tax=Mycena pura TaxID=153505 RepID=A0AAD6V4V0_9AGAR|nr:hypothetical protein GGX14DRAFT_653044 [Mycena pura]
MASISFLDWLEQDDETLLLVNHITSTLQAGNTVKPKILNLLRTSLEDAPLEIKLGDQPKSQDELISLWNEIQSMAPDQAQAKAGLLLEMWGDSAPSSLIRKRSHEDDKHATLLNAAFTREFQGDSIDAFCNTMHEYQNTYTSDNYYGRVIAWHGPSGVGKSKGVHALAQRHPTFSVCFRDSRDPRDGWPPGDTQAYRFFKGSVKQATPEERVAAFLGAFLDEACESAAGKDPIHTGQSWQYVYEEGVTYEDSARGKKFARIEQRAKMLLLEAKGKMEVDIRDPRTGLLLDRKPEPEDRYQQLWNQLCRAPAEELIKALGQPKFCFIAFDECTDIPFVDPISLRRILEAGNGIENLWFILLGTNAKIQSLQPSVLVMKPSARLEKLSCLPTWCHFGFAQLAPSEPETPRAALDVDYLRRIGRPLFATYSTTRTAYRTARQKLFSPARKFDPHKETHVFVVFSHRILLSLGNTDTAVQIAAESVHSNLRYVKSIDGNIVRTVCPSEPLLSLISMDALNKDNNFAASLKTLVSAMKQSTIDRGEEGELYCRLLLMRARDVACQNDLPSSLRDRLFGNKGGSGSLNQDTFSQASFQVRLITLKSHLDALVHLDGLGIKMQAQADKLREYAGPYWVNITHTIRLESSITALSQEYLKELFIRGAMVQCTHNQPVIDGFYVAYGGELGQAWDLNKFLIVTYQSKAKAAAASQAELVASLTGPMQVKPDGRRCKPNQIVLLMDLNAKAAFQGFATHPVQRYLQISHRVATVPILPPSNEDNNTPANKDNQTPAKSNKDNQKPAKPKKDKDNRKPAKPWGGYATAAGETEPKTWCINIRGHDSDSYRCAKATEHESKEPKFEQPNFTSLFDEVQNEDAAARESRILGPITRAIDASLHPLQTAY